MNFTDKLHVKIQTYEEFRHDSSSVNVCKVSVDGVEIPNVIGCDIKIGDFCCPEITFKICADTVDMEFEKSSADFLNVKTGEKIKVISPSK